jgi:ATPase subunit of ABC transporter with duplicated ATPase domains
MNQASINFQGVSFTYDAMTSPLLEELTVHFPIGWTGIIGANGVGKTTILRLATGELKPQQGRVSGPGNRIYCQQRTDDIPDMLFELMEATDGDACEIKDRLEVDDDWPRRWATLSHGERKRAQIAVAMWCQPRVLAVDEPTNHLDIEPRDLLFSALGSFQGIGLLVSHDRELLDGLCHQCLFVEPPEAVMRPGNFSEGSRQADQDEEYIKRQYHLAKRAHVKLKREASKRRDVAAQSHRMRSKRGLAMKDYDARNKINRARISGKDGTGGKLLRQIEGRLTQAREKQEKIKVKKMYEMGIWLPGSRSRRDTLFRLSAGSIPLGGDRWLHFPDLLMRPDDRIALTGPNGGGKSTLVRHILRSLNIPKEHTTYIPQEIDTHSSKDIMARVPDLPKDKLGQIMTVVSRLGSRPHRLLESTDPSPGEIRKVLLAIGIANVPHLIMMDEPTNHLDLPSIECLEDALAECPCGLFLVSHDRHFLDRLTRTRWHISRKKDDQNNFILHNLEYKRDLTF